MTSLTQIYAAPLAEQVIQELRTAIVRGDFQHGARLTETDLAARLGVSRSPVREALRQLEHDGWVTRSTNRGSYVAVFGAEDIVELFLLRAALEGLGLARARHRLRTEDFDYLASCIAQTEVAIRATDLDRVTQWDVKFHERIMIKASLPRTFRLWKPVMSQCQALLNRRFHVWPEDVPSTAITDHKAILTALRNDDLVELQRLNAEINQRVARELLTVEADGLNGGGADKQTITDRHSE